MNDCTFIPSSFTRNLTHILSCTSKFPVADAIHNEYNHCLTVSALPNPTINYFNSFSAPLSSFCSQPCTLLWLRAGHLRLADNLSVTVISSRSDPVLPIVTLSYDEVCLPVLETLAELHETLNNLGSALIVRFVENSIYHHITALCRIADTVRSSNLVFTDNCSFLTSSSSPLRRRFVTVSSYPLSVCDTCYKGEYHNPCDGHIFDFPHSFPPLPSAARHIDSDFVVGKYKPRGEKAARIKLSGLINSQIYERTELQNLMGEELGFGCISHCRLRYELKRLRDGHRSAQQGRPMKRTRRPSIFEPFFIKNTPTIAALSFAAYDVNGGDRRGLEWDESTKSFVLQEWEHTENERKMSPPKRFQEFVRRRRLFLTRAFFPEDVTPDYYSFTLWRFAQRCVSSTIGVFGTSSLLLALGIRSGRIGQAAVVSWVLKDGLGRVGKMVWAGSMGKDFDVDPKRWRFRSAILYALGNGLEIVTQIFPASFLVFATAANTMKQVSMLTSSATRNAMYRSFGERSQNIANITAKGEAQIVVADLIGMACGIRLSKIFGSSRRSVLSAYSFLTLLDIFGIYMELRQVVFRSLNAERSSIIINRALEDGTFLSPSEVSPRESIFLRPKYKKWVRLSSIAKAAKDPSELSMLLGVFRRERFMVSTPRTSGGPCRLVLRRDAKNEDVLRAMLLVGIVQKELGNNDNRVISLEESQELLNNARTVTKSSFSWLMEGLQEKGWNTDNLLFSTMKRRGYWGS